MMQTIAGRFNGNTIELLDDAPVTHEATNVAVHLTAR